MQMIFKLTVDFVQHLIHQHCCHTRRAHPKRSAAQAVSSIVAKNPILISPAWILSFLALESSFWRFQAEPKSDKKLDNERYVHRLHRSVCSLHIYRTMCCCNPGLRLLCMCVRDTCDFRKHYRMTCNQRRTITWCHLNYYNLKALFTSHFSLISRRSDNVVFCFA